MRRNFRYLCMTDFSDFSDYMTDVEKSDISPPHPSCVWCREGLHVTYNVSCFVPIYAVLSQNLFFLPQFV